MDLTTPPHTPLWRMAVKRNRWHGELPRLEVRWRGARLTEKLDAYRELCDVRGEQLPLCWPQVAAEPLHSWLIAHGDFPLAAMGLVHVTQRIERFRPLAVDATWDVRAFFDGHQLAKRGIEVRMCTELSDGESVAWRGETVFLSRGAPGDGQDRPRTEAPPSEVIDTQHWELPSDLGRRYAVVAGDSNPIHMYAWTARLFGFQRAIMHGMWVVGRVLGAVDDAANSVDVRFVRPVLLPSTVRFERGADGRFAVWGDDKPCVLGQLS